MSPDIIVIGGGIAGASAAALMAEKARVLVLEAEARPGTHSTGRSAAIFIRNYGNDALRALNRLSEPVLEAPEGVSDTSLLSPRGELILADETELDDLAAYAEGAEGLERLTGAEAVEMVPILRPEGVASALYEPGARDIDVDRMLSGYLRLLKARGGTVETGAEVQALARNGGLWEVQTSKGRFTAPLVVNAAGAWAEAIGRMAGALPMSLVPHRRSAAILPAPEGHDPRGWPLFAAIRETWYAKPDAGKLMVSPADADPVPAGDAWPDDMVLAEGLHRFEQAVTMEVTRVERSWAGLRTFAPDHTPVMGADPVAEGFFWLAGQGGYGVQTAPAMAEALAGEVFGQSALPESLRAALSPARFQA
ncbi:MAG: FAD-binding oxidoreductase [Roseovarius sp.]